MGIKYNLTMAINKIEVNIENIFVKQILIPNRSKNIPIYMGFLVLEKTPSVIRYVDLSNPNVVLYLLNKSRDFPLITNPAYANKIPKRLYGKSIQLYWGSKK
jgi:hypothetical protein